MREANLAWTCDIECSKLWKERVQGTWHIQLGLKAEPNSCDAKMWEQIKCKNWREKNGMCWEVKPCTSVTWIYDSVDQRYARKKVGLRSGLGRTRKSEFGLGAGRFRVEYRARPESEKFAAGGGGCRLKP